MNYNFYIQRTSERIKELKEKQTLPVYKDNHDKQWWFQKLIEDNEKVLKVLFDLTRGY